MPTRVLAAEELIASKLFVNFRERFDGADMVHIIFGTSGRLDWQRLRQLGGRALGDIALGVDAIPLRLSGEGALRPSRSMGRPAVTTCRHSLNSPYADAGLPRQPARREDVCHRRARMGHGEPACRSNARDRRPTIGKISGNVAPPGAGTKHENRCRRRFAFHSAGIRPHSRTDEPGARRGRRAGPGRRPHQLTADRRRWSRC